MSPDPLKNERLEDELRGLAQSLLEDPRTGAILQRVGTRHAFTDAEREEIRERTDNSAVLKPFIELDHLQARISAGPSWELAANRVVVTGLARRAAEGDFQSLSDADALELVRRNMVDCPRADAPIGERFRRSSRRYVPADVLQRSAMILREDAGFFDASAGFSRVRDEVNFDSHNDRYAESMGPLLSIVMEVVHRFGWWVNPYPITEMMCEFAECKVPADDDLRMKQLFANYRLIDPQGG